MKFFFFWGEKMFHLGCIKMMRKGFLCVINLPEFSRTLWGRRPLAEATAFSHYKPVTDSPASFLRHSFLPIIATIWFIFKINILIDSETSFWYWPRQNEVSGSWFVSLLFEKQNHFLLCSSSCSYFEFPMIPSLILNYFHWLIR